MKYKDYYKIMEVESNASLKEIKQAFHRLAHKYHPDVSQEPDALERFKEINQAYDVLKEPKKRAAYHASFKVISPYTYTWFIAKKNAWIHNYAKMRAKKNAGLYTQFLGQTKKKVGIPIQTRSQKKTEDSSMKLTQKWPLFLMGIFVLILSSMTIGIIFAVEQFAQWQDYQQIQTAILQGDETAIETLERSKTETAQKILEGEQVKKALVHFYLQQVDHPLSILSETYDDIILANILKDNEVYRALITYYYQKIDNASKADNFKAAFLLLDTLKDKYPNSKELSDKSIEIENKKKQRLAELTQLYFECLDQTLAPLLERTHCMADARKKIEYVGIEHSLPTDSNLPEMYADEIELALVEKNYERAELVLLDWQKILQAPSEQRDHFKQSLALRKQLEDIIADLSGRDDKKIKKRLSQLTSDPVLQAEVLEMPQIQRNLVRYYLDETLAIMALEEEKVNIHPVTITKLKQIIMVTEDTPSQPIAKPWYSDSVSLPPSSVKKSKEPTKVAGLLRKCKKHFDANRLTTGKQGTALACYNKVLRKAPGNREAKAGKRNIEKRYVAWAKSALRRNQLGKAKIYLASLKKVNSKSPALAQLRRRLKNAKNAPKKKKSTQTATVKKSPKPKPKPKPKTSTPPSICEGCNCSNLFKQLSMGVKALTPAQMSFLRTQCR